MNNYIKCDKILVSCMKFYDVVNDILFIREQTEVIVKITSLKPPKFSMQPMEDHEDVLDARK